VALLLRLSAIEIMKNKPQTFAGIGALIGTALASFAAVRQYDFAVTREMQQGVGYILGGFIMGAIVGYLIGKSMKG
jgi:galactitol-specific phosphotransferase system IIC component